MTKLYSNSKKNIITQSNEISEAAYYLSLKAKRVLWMCFSQLKSSDNNHASQLFSGSFKVYVSDYQNLFGVSTEAASRDVRAALSEISTSSVIFYPKEGEDEEIERPWLIEKAMKRGRGVFRVEFNPKLVPYIVGLTEQFTVFYLHECGRISNSRTIRLYENLCQWRSTGVWLVTPAWLAERYKLPVSQRNNLAEMRRSFLDPAIKRINKETPLTVSYITQGHGLSESKLLFNIVDNKFVIEDTQC